MVDICIWLAVATLTSVILARLVYISKKEDRELDWLYDARQRVLNGGHLSYEEAKTYNKLDISMRDDRLFITKQDGYDENCSYMLASRDSDGNVKRIDFTYTNLVWAKHHLVGYIEQHIKDIEETRKMREDDEAILAGCID